MKYLIEAYSGRILSVLLGEDGRAVEIRADSRTDGLKLGDICIGRVERVAANTGACFVEVARGIKGYLPLDDLSAPRYTRKGSSPKVQQGDELIVQVSREAFGTKDMSLTTKLQLSGRYLLLEMSGTGLGISRKIQEERRRALREHLFSEQTLEEMRQQLGSCGVIVRTNAEHAPDEDIRKELQNLTGAMHQLLLTAPYRPAYTVLLRQPDRWLKRIESVQAEKLEEILTDDRNLYEALEDYLPPYLKEKLRFYQDPIISMHNVFSRAEPCTLQEGEYEKRREPRDRADRSPCLNRRQFCAFDQWPGQGKSRPEGEHGGGRGVRQADSPEKPVRNDSGGFYQHGREGILRSADETSGSGDGAGSDAGEGRGSDCTRTCRDDPEKGGGSALPAAERS